MADWKTARGGNTKCTLTAAAGPSPCDPPSPCPYNAAVPKSPAFSFLNYYNGPKKHIEEYILASLEKSDNAMGAVELKRKQKNIPNGIVLFLRSKGWKWTADVHVPSCGTIKGHYHKRIDREILRRR